MDRFEVSACRLAVRDGRAVLDAERAVHLGLAPVIGLAHAELMTCSGSTSAQAGRGRRSEGAFRQRHRLCI